ncbi:MAG: division plane positioning ATPase MipZ [Alphaproteobacteria bacterium]|nr:division plane positioning ATPase MipZ [Alphaproteobacteria bacterium]
MNTAARDLPLKDDMPEQSSKKEQPSLMTAPSDPMVNDDAAQAGASDRYAHIVVVGNQKGGSGKSTTTMHVIASLLSTGASVASIDLDARQGTLTRYMENRRNYAERRGINLLMPTHRSIEPSSVASIDVARAHDAHSVEKAVQDLAPRHDYIVIDTPGTDNFLSRVGHSYSDTLITPLNDSFIDLDVLAMIDPETYAMTRPSKYAEMVFQVKMQKARREKSNRTFDWVVMRNRTAQLDSRNQRSMEEALGKLSSRVGFRQVPGFSERVIFRELFLDGLTLLDLKTPGTDIRMNMSHLSARQEVRDLMAAIGLDRETE